MVAVRITLNEQEFRKLASPNGMVGRAVQRAAGVTRDRAKRIITQSGRVDTGAMRQAVRSEVISYSSSSGSWYRIVCDLPYAIYQHEGVPGPVLPRRAKVLRFKPKGGNGYVFARRTKGFEGIHFLTRALSELSVSDFSATSAPGGD